MPPWPLHCARATQLYSTANKTLPGAPICLFSPSPPWAASTSFVSAIRIDHDGARTFATSTEAHRAQRAQAHGEGKRKTGRSGTRQMRPHLRVQPRVKPFHGPLEAPLPTSPVCNARCIGCISLQKRKDLSATQDRITFVPTPEEVCGVAVPHLEAAPRAVVSFGQGCEGEPLLQAATLEASIAMMRKATARGTINLNTNGSFPDEVEKLCRAGLDSIRVSMNSARPGFYHKYFRPRGYTFDDARRSILAVKANGGFASINYFVLPGFTDQETEWEALKELVSETRLDLIQMRNLNIDPEWYMASMGTDPQEETIGVGELISRLKNQFPALRLGYFNPPLDSADVQ